MLSHSFVFLGLIFLIIFFCIADIQRVDTANKGPMKIVSKNSISTYFIMVFRFLGFSFSIFLIYEYF